MNKFDLRIFLWQTLVLSVSRTLKELSPMFSVCQFCGRRPAKKSLSKGFLA